MQIILNGQTHEIPSKCTVLQVLEDKAVTLYTAVVELNGEILKQEQWQSTVMHPGDQLEILVFLGGG